jgi:radical SAM superfamily enzyme YgiQ (UPF0313 family)
MKLTIIAVSEPNKYPQFFRRFVHTSNLVLPVLASLTPTDVQVELVDESVYIRKPDYQKLQTDLAALSVRTSCANRAYAISDLLRSRGIKTVVGGIHPTVLPNESKEHADAVVIGEAEAVWQQVIHDSRQGGLKPFYEGKTRPDLKNLPIPRRELLRFPNRAFLSLPTIQTGRGCPHNCAFCSVTKVYGRTYRQRPVENVVSELQALKRSYPFYQRPVRHWQDGLLFFLDDNLLGNCRYARELLVALRSFKKKWYTQASVSIARDEETLKLAKEAGCCVLALGLESVIQASLDYANKTCNQTDFYHDAVERIHSAGIMVAASFVLGFDEDDASVFEKTLNFAVESGLDFASFHILTPYPGTPFYDQMKREGRLLVPDGHWQKFDTQHVVFRPRKMTPWELQEGFRWLWREFVSLKSIWKRAGGTKHRWFYWPVNLFIKAIISGSLVKFQDTA